VANIVAGHLLIVLLRSPLIKASWIILTLGLIVLFLLVLLERGVSLIQGYVFSLLSSLYLGERNGAKLNYLNKITSL
jgi:F0F1-type ATP synthase membrane subunit a